jgi:hypothetical protein
MGILEEFGIELLPSQPGAFIAAEDAVLNLTSALH